MGDYCGSGLWNSYIEIPLGSSTDSLYIMKEKLKDFILQIRAIDYGDIRLNIV